MFVGHARDLEMKAVAANGAINVKKQSLIGPLEGWDGWVMRLFTLGAKGETPRHKHPWPHINYVVQGSGILYLEGRDHRIEAGSIAYVPSDAEHQFMNDSGSELAFICIVPEEGDK